MRMRTAGRWPQMRRAVRSHPSSRGAFRVTAVAVVMVAAGMTAGSAPAASRPSQQHVTVQMGYTCVFHSGSEPVSTEITATFPAAATVGQPIQPTGARIAVTLPHAAIANLSPLHAASATLTAGLGTVLTEGRKSSTAEWQDFSSPAKHVPQSGPMTFTASGTAPQITGSAPGQITIAAAGLGLLFTGSAPVNSPASSPGRSPASSHGLPVVCVPATGQNRTLASIPVAPTASSPSPSHHHITQAAKPQYCPHFPKHLKLNPRFPLPKPPPGSSSAYEGYPACSYAGGFTDARKLHEAALIGPGLTDFLVGVPFIHKYGPYTYFQIRVAGKFNYHGLPQLPPARATLLAFGFMPVSATLQISEVGALNAALIDCVPAKQHCPNNPPSFALFYGRVMLHISNVDINGVPLNVGAHCQTATPFNLALTGVPPSYNVSALYGVLTGTVTIPSFSGCANHSDNLDPIFDSTVSGPGNFAKISQAQLCYVHNPTKQTCPPRKPHMKH